MPRVLERDPVWLSREAPGFQLFRPDDSKPASKQAQTTHYNGPSRKIAYRIGRHGSELFVAVGGEVRWAELGQMKDAAEDFERRHGKLGTAEMEGSKASVLRVLKVPGAANIQQLSVSPSGEYLAVLTAHTCRVLILPASSHLHSGNFEPLSPKSFQVGPTAHVHERAPMATAIWHPLSTTGNCLITVTQDSCVRMWELNKDNRSTFDEPSLAVDLKKLGSAGTMRDDLGASKYGANRRFSPDDEEMQAAGACFGGSGRDDEHGWASMTLWVAMTEGDVYALCPFLPSKWVAPTTMMPSLTTSVMAKSRALSGGDVTSQERLVAEQQMSWLSEVDSQEPTLRLGADVFDAGEIYSRPGHPGDIPRLQGPFSLNPEPDFGEITDIHVIAPKLDDDALYDEDYEDLGAEEGLSIGLVCLTTTTSKLFVCLDIEGVAAEWLPSRRAKAFTPDEEEVEKSLLLFETVDLAVQGAESDGWPTFTPSPTDRYQVFTSSPVGVHTLSFRPWIGDLEAELSGPSDSGVDFRINNVFLETATTYVDQPIRLPADPDCGINAAIAVLDQSIGYILLTSATNVPFAALLEQPSSHQPFAPDEFAPAGALPAPEPRAPYQPAEELFRPSELPQVIKTANDSDPRGRITKSEIRFSPAVLKLMTEAHRVIGDETHKLGLAAADLFRRCDRMRLELQEQIRRVQEIALKVDRVIGEEGEPESGADDDDDDDNDDAPLGNERIEQRILQAESKTAELNSRADHLRQRIQKLGSQQLSAKEKAFAEEVEALERTVKPLMDKEEIGAEAETVNGATEESLLAIDDEDDDGGSLAERFRIVQSMLDPLSTQAEKALKRIQDREGSDAVTAPSSTAGGVQDFKRQKVEQVWSLLERQKAMVEALGERMRRLGVGEGL